MDRGTYDDYPSRKPGDHPDIAKTLKRVEDEIRNEPYEWSVGINAKTGEEVFRITDGHQSNVNFLNHPEAMVAFEEHRDDLIITHNHPVGGAPLSDSDVGLLFAHGGREMRACGSDGRTYSILVTDEMRGDPTIEPALERMGLEMREDMARDFERRVAQEGIQNADQIEKEIIYEGLLKAGGEVAYRWRDKGARYTVIEGGGRSDSLFRDSFPRWDSSLRRLIQY